MSGMRPPPAKGAAGNSAGARSLRHQAILDAAMQSGGHRGPLGTLCGCFPACSTTFKPAQAAANLGNMAGTIPDEPSDVSGTDSQAADTGPETSGRPAPLSRRPSAAPATWDAYFDRLQNVHLPEQDATFRVYHAGDTGPVLFCLHGGGYTALTWALLASRVKDRCRVAAMDMRGHGASTTAADSDLSAAALSQDVVAVWRALFAEERAPTVLVGHSMGGAIAVYAAASQGITSLEGVVVIDVVEGTALASLPHMGAVLNHRPTSFPSLQAAIHWAHSTGMSRNVKAAAVSLPSCLREEAAPDSAEQQDSEPASRWVWRTDLSASACHWQGWYEGLSATFLGVTAPKVLVLAGTDRLDRPLTIGQMQGKFQLVLLPQAGHAIQEDEPQRTAEVLLAFVNRFRIGEPKLAIPRPAGAGVVLPAAVGRQASIPRKVHALSKSSKGKW